VLTSGKLPRPLSLSLSLSLYSYIPMYICIIYIYIYIYISIYDPSVTPQTAHLGTNRSTCILTRRHVFLFDKETCPLAGKEDNLPTYQPTNLPTYEPTNLRTYEPTDRPTNQRDLPNLKRAMAPPVHQISFAATKQTWPYE